MPPLFFCDIYHLLARIRHVVPLSLTDSVSSYSLSSLRPSFGSVIAAPTTTPSSVIYLRRFVLQQWCIGLHLGVYFAQGEPVARPQTTPTVFERCQISSYFASLFEVADASRGRTFGWSCPSEAYNNIPCQTCPCKRRCSLSGDAV